MPNPKCKNCGKEVNRDVGFSISVNGKNWWFCNEEEYLAWQKEKTDEKQFRVDMNDLLNLNLDITQDKSWEMVKSYLDSLRKRYSRDEIYWYFDCNIDNISKTLGRKNFDSEYGMMRYLITMVSNGISEFLKHTPVPAKQDEVVEVEDFYMAPVRYRPSNLRRAMSFIEQMEDDNG